ncbi:MAG: RloB domain-containing protein [Clostridia bacterium]|nr:RloB domain-containing protein [Clostridia bacterium]
MPKDRRKGQRKPRSIGSRSNTPDLGYYLIVTDTKETEQNYMFGLRDSIPDELKRRLIIKVSKTKTDNLVSEALSQAALQPQYSEPWIIFDRDQVKNFDSIIQNAEAVGINTGWSNPCIEIWFNAYFGAMPTYQTSVACCDGFETTFEKAANQKYQKSDKQIYNKLCKYGDEADAIKIAENKLKQCIINGMDKPSEMCPVTTVHRLVKEIRDKILK